MVRFSPKAAPLDYSKCNQTVTLYRATFSPEFKCERKVIKDRAFLDFKRTENVDKTGNKGASSFLLVIKGEVDIKPQDKVFYGIGKEITTREEWADFVPPKQTGLVVVEYVDPKFWNGKVCHMEAGG